MNCWGCEVWWPQFNVGSTESNCLSGLLSAAPVYSKEPKKEVNIGQYKDASSVPVNLVSKGLEYLGYRV